MIQTISEYYREHKIYVWGVKRNSMAVFAKLAFRGINVSGFVVEEQRYSGEMFFNRPVLHIEDFLASADAIIIAADVCAKDRFSQEMPIYYLNDIWEVNSDLKDEQIIIYGTGKGAEYIYHQLMKKGIEVEAFCVTSQNNQTEFMGLPVLNISDIEITKKCAVIISAINETYKLEMQNNLENKGVPNIYTDEFMPRTDLLMSPFIQSLYKAIKENKKIYIYTKKVDENAELITRMLLIYQVEVTGFLYHEGCSDERIEDIYEMVYEDISDKFIIVNIADKCELQDACELLENLGFSLSRFDYIGLRIPAYEYKNPPKNISDSLLGYSRNGEKAGFCLYGCEKPENTRIVILGGSTSNDGNFRCMCWPKIFYQKLHENGYKVTVYNGAHSGQNVIHELLRLLRDGLLLKPQYVISMGGGNDSVNLYPETKNRFCLSHMIDKEKELGLENRYCHGIEVQEDNFDFWLREERVMKAVCEEYGIKFFCFLQPMKFGKKNMSLFEECVHNDEKREAYSFREKSSADDFYENLITLFDEKEGMYIDACHYSEEANRILADIVYDKIASSL